MINNASEVEATVRRSRQKEKFLMAEAFSSRRFAELPFDSCKRYFLDYVSFRFLNSLVERGICSLVDNYRFLLVSKQSFISILILV